MDQQARHQCSLQEESQLEGCAANRFQLLVRIHNMLACVRNLIAQESVRDMNPAVIEELMFSVHSLARTARTEGLPGYAATCLRVAERIEPFRRMPEVPRSTLQLLATWLVNSDRYLRQPNNRYLVSFLVRHLGSETWGSPLSDAEQDHLVEGLITTRRRRVLA